ncbi:MAG: hypothetical protein RQ899_14155, partial [Pseudomonadales bacterium]|nr:hypothetical protein [Pseudomonadales bacterium]
DADPAQTLVVEDSRNGLLAAHGAGLNCLVTVNGYTRHENFAEACMVVSDLGEPGSTIDILANSTRCSPGDYLELADLMACMPLDN